MSSQTKENYLKAIYFLSREQGDVSLTRLSREMNVSTPTVNSMVKKLQENNWVIYQKYKPLKLTPEGERAAALIIRKHRLTEMYLVEKMGFGWEEVHDIAEQIEHIQSPVLFERMDEILGRPEMDPHGSPIPDKNGKVAARSYSKLSEIEPGHKVRVCAVTHSSKAFLQLLNQKHLELGTELNVISREPFDQSMTVSHKKVGQTMLSFEVCDRLLVEPA